MQHIFDIQGEYQKQQMVLGCLFVKFILKQDVPDVALDAIEQIYLKQCARDWKSWVPAAREINPIRTKIRIHSRKSRIHSKGIHAIRLLL
jgi:hypothetical protein